MSSTSSPIPASSGECVVCGQVTTTRCSSCASQGLSWMFFCSKEHQKLVSPFAPVTIDKAYLCFRFEQIHSAHRRVCGSDPFNWPLFSKGEASRLRSRIGSPKDARGKVELGKFFEECRPTRFNAVPIDVSLHYPNTS